MSAAPMPNDNVRAARLMLSTVFGGKEDGHQVVLFQLEPARSTSFTDIGAAATYAADKANVYVHVGLSTRPFTGGDRPEASEIDALGGLGADIDIAGAGHKKPGLPPTEEAARAILDALNLPYGLLVHSGGGLQAWWPFAEPWVFDSDDERRRARILLRAFGITIRERAKQLGYAVDMVSDLARVLRVPGTVNTKTGSPRPVRILEQTGRTIAEDDVLSVLYDGAWEQAERDIDQKRASGDQINYGELILDPSAEPPWSKLDALREVEPRFDQSWRRHRTKRSETWSSSEWDQSLAAYAAQAGWSRQEIANLLIASRRKHGDDLKLRQDYYAATINKATAGREEVEAIREAVAVSTQLLQEPPEERSESERSDVLATLSKSLGVEITRVTRSPSEPPVFGIETPHGSGQLGPIKIIASNQAFRMRVGEITNRFPRRMKNDQWDTIAQALLQVAELEELGVETTLAGKAETLLSLYLGNHPRQVWSEMSDKARMVLPIRLDPFIDEDGVTRIFASGIRSWLAEHQHEPMTRTEIATMLRAIGAEPETRHFGVGKSRTTRSVWRIPNGK